MNKLLCLFLAFFALVSASNQRELSSYVFKVLSEDASIASSVLSEISAEISFTGSFSDQISEVDSIISGLLESTTLTIENDASTTTITPSTHNAAAAGVHGKNVAGVVALILAVMGFMMVF